MVAIVAGNGLGLLNTSNNILGNAGVLGDGWLGQARGRSYVNAATGNLVLQFEDEMLSGRGADLSLLRTYNSSAQLSDDIDGDGWRWDGESTVLFNADGTLGSGGSITRRTGDGHVATYTWNSAKQRYVSTEGDGAYDTLSYNSSTHEWTWTDGSTRSTEIYSDTTTATSMRGRLLSRTDVSGNKITFAYDDGNRLTEITDFGSGQKIKLVYSGTPAKLQEVDTYELIADGNGRITDPPTVATTPIKQVGYTYNNGRLETVRTVLDVGSASSKVYVTTYGYGDRGSSLITSITQSDGTGSVPYRVTFTYDGGRVTSVTDANGTQTFQYKAVANGVASTDITLGSGANAQVWTYTYDASTRQLLRVDSPPPVTGAARLTTQYQYDSSGNVTKIVDGRGNAVIYQYDANGNRTIERDSSGNTIARSYDSASNRLLTETRYTTADSGLDEGTQGVGSAAGGMTTHYVYDTVDGALARLRFTVTAEGRVTESRYNSSGLIERTVHYTAERYSGTDFSEQALASWVSGRSDKSQIELTQFTYDFRGNLATRTDFSRASASTGEGNIATDAAASVTEYIYDGHGALRQTIVKHGSTRNDAQTLTSYAYDGMGREIRRVTAAGTQTTEYDDANNVITVKMQSGQWVVSAYNSVGTLISVTRTDTLASGTPARGTQYFYDSHGRLAMTREVVGKDANGNLLYDNRRFTFYDAAGRVQFTVDAAGSVSGYTYNETGQVIGQTRYHRSIPPSVTDSWFNGTEVTKTALTLGASGTDVITDANDRTLRYTFDKSGRLSTRTDAAGTVTTNEYDGASRLTAQRVSNSTTPDVRSTRFFYDADGNQVGVVDPLGYLTESKYDAAGRLVETIRYATRSSSTANVAAPVFVGAADQTAIGGKAFSYRLQATDADGDAITYTTVGTLPSWLTLDTSVANAPTLKGTPPIATANYDVTLRASDGRGKTTDVRIRIAVANTPPSWARLPDLTVRLNGTANFVLPEAVDNEGGALTYSIDASLLPPGMRLEGRSLLGTPTVAGTYIITARVSDSQGATTERTFTLRVANNRPGWSMGDSTPPQPMRNHAYSYVVPTPDDPERQALTYRIVSAPSWLSLRSATSTELVGTPVSVSTLGAYVVVLEAQDPTGEVVRLAFGLFVMNRPPEWSAEPQDITVAAGSAIDYTLPRATDPEGEAVTYGYSGVLPPGVTFDAATGRISGTTRGADVGDYFVQVYAVDPLGGASGASESRQIVIRLFNTPPTKVPGTPELTASGFYFNPIRLTIQTDWFTDVQGDPVTLEVLGAQNGLTDGAPGLWAAWDPRFIVVGFIDVDPADAGGRTRVFTLRVRDSRGAISDFPITLVVNALPPPPPPTPPTFPPDNTPPPGGGGSPRPPHQPPVAPPGGGGVAEAIGPAPAPVLGIAPAPAPVISAAPPPRQVRAAAAIAPITDVLASLRPATTADDLHTYRYYDGRGRLVGSMDSRGFLTETVYDEQANTQQTLRYMKAVTASSSDTLDALRTRATQDSGEVQATTLQFDSFGRVSTMTAVDGTTTRYEYDAAGRLTRQILAEGQLESDNVSNAQRVIRNRYDAFDEVTGTMTGVGEAWLTAHPGQLDDAIARFGMRYQYDALGRRIRVTDADTSTERDHSTLSFYDAEGRLTHTLNAAGEVSTLDYNSFGEVATARRYGTRLDVSGALFRGLMDGTKGRNDLLAAIPGLGNSEKDAANRYTYDQRGLLKDTTDALGFVTSNTYTAFGQLETQVRAILKNANGQSTRTSTTRFNYDLDGQLLSTNVDDGGINYNTQRAYDAFGRVIKSIDAAGRETRTFYLDGGRNIEVTDPLGRKVRTEYDAFERVEKMFDAVQMARAASDRLATRYTYKDAERKVVVTTPEGVQVTTIKTRDGQVLSVKDGRGSATSYGYDLDGRQTTVTDALQRQIGTRAYDSRGRLISSTDARGVVTQFKYDAANRMFERRVDPKDTNTNPLGLDLVTTYVFDALGRQVTVIEGTGNNLDRNIARVTSWKYDLEGRMLQVVVDPDRTNSDGTAYTGLKLATTYEYDGVGNLTKLARGTVASPNQEVVAYEYDKAGRRTKEIVAPGTYNLTTEYRYNALGLLSRKIDANGNSTWFVYDADGELTLTVNALGEVTQQLYDADGRVIASRGYTTRYSSSTLAGFGDVVTASPPSTSATDRQTYFAYDNDGRQRFTLQAVDATHWIASEKRYDANGNVVETRAYDQWLPQSFIDANDTGSSPGIGVDEIQAQLQALGYSSTNDSTLARVERTRFAYDANNRLRFTVDAEGSVTERTYDAGGNVIKTVRYASAPTLRAFGESDISGAVNAGNAANQVTRFIYDTAGRVRYTLRVLANDQQVLNESVYDAVGRVVQTFARAKAINLSSFQERDYTVGQVGGQIVVSNDDRRSAFLYDAAGRQIYAVRAAGLNRDNVMQYAVTSQSYDDMGHLTRSTAYAKARTLADFAQATIDAAVNASEVANDVDNRTTRLVYDTAGRQRFVVAADRTVSENVYDALGQVVEKRRLALTVPTSIAIDENHLVDLRSARTVGDGETRGERYSFDAAGRVLSITDAAGKSEVFTYDALGNRRTRVDKNGVDTLNQHRNDNPPFDAQRVTWTYSYDLLGRLTEQNTPKVDFQLHSESAPPSAPRQITTRHEYDALGNIVRTTQAFGTSDACATTFEYDRLNRLKTTTPPAASVQLSDGTVATIALKTAIEYDVFGNVTRRIEAQGTLDERATTFEYDAFNRQTKATLPGSYDPSTGRVVRGSPSGTFARTLETTYNVFGDAVRTAARKGTGSNDFVFTYKTYDVMGRVVYDVDARGNVTGFAYTVFGEQSAVTRFGKNAGVPGSGSNNLWTSTAVATALGSDATARTITTSYDTMGRKLQVTEPTSGNYYYGSGTTGVISPSIAGTNAAGVTKYEYNAFGEVVHQATKIDEIGLDVYNRNGHWRDTFRYYDVMGRETVTIDTLGHRTDREYDANGNLKLTTEYEIPLARGTPGILLPPSIVVPRSGDRITRYSYNALDQQIGVERLNLTYTDSNGNVVRNGRTTPVLVASMTYDTMGHVRTLRDALGNVTTTQYNVLGQSIQIIEPARVTAAMTSLARTVPVSGVAGARASTDPFANQVTASPRVSMTFDAFGNVVREERNPNDGGPTRITLRSYDFGGNLASTTDANTAALQDAIRAFNNTGPSQPLAVPGPTVEFKYDYAGRVIAQTRRINVTLGTGETVSQTLERRFGYDANGKQTEAVDLYRDGSGAQRMSGLRSTYNAFGEVVETRRISGAVSADLTSLSGPIETSYTYDNAGHLINKVGADGFTMYYYNLTGEVTRQEQRGDSRIASSGATTSATRIAETVYDALGRATLQMLPDNGFMPVVRQTYDRWGNVVSHAISGYVNGSFQQGGETTLYEYNADNQMIAERRERTQAWRSNGTSYRARVTHAIRYDLLGRAVMELDLADDADTNGDEATVLATRSRRYNAAGQLIETTDATGITTQYAYDGNGNNVGRLTLGKADGGGNRAKGTVFVDRFDLNGNVLQHGILRLSDLINPYVSGSGQTPEFYSTNEYQYDQANRRVASGEAMHDPGNTIYTTYTYYDERDLVIKHRVPSLVLIQGLVDVGILTTYDYDAFGKRTLQVDANGNGQTWSYSNEDYRVGRMTATSTGTAFNGNSRTFGVLPRTTTYSYTDMGQVAAENYSGQGLTGTNSRSYAYYNGGLVRDITDVSNVGTAGETGGVDYWHTDETVHYEYNEKGARIRETFARTGSQDVREFDIGLRRWVTTARTMSAINRATNTSYDELGRMVNVVATPEQNPGTPELTLTYSYDELGNRRRILAVYQGGQVSDKWFAYDSEGRMTVVDGELRNGQIGAGRSGTNIGYDAFGRRATIEKFLKHSSRDNHAPPGEILEVTDWDQYRAEQYEYNDLGQLRRIWQTINEHNGVIVQSRNGSSSSSTFDRNGEWRLLEDRTLDGRGATLTSKRYAELFSSVPQDLQGGGLISTVSASYRADGQLFNRTTINNAPGATEADHTFVKYNYDDAGILRSYFYDQGIGQHRVFENTYNYEYAIQFGGYKETQITVSSTDGDARNNTTRNQYDSRGQLIKQTISEAGKERTLNFIYDNEGHIITKWTRDSNNVEGTEHYRYALGHEVARIGTGTLAGAQFDNGYRPVDQTYPANAPGNYTVNTGDTLASIAQVLFGDAQLWYIIAEANSLGFGPSDALPAMEVGKTYRIPNVIANVHNNARTFTPYDAARIIGNSVPAPVIPPPPEQSCASQVGHGVLTAFIVASSAVLSGAVTAVLTPFIGPILASSVGSVAGNLEAQTVGVLAGTRDGFSLDEIENAAVEGYLGGFAGVIAASASNEFVRTGLQSLGNQGVRVLEGKDTSFEAAGWDLGANLALHGADAGIGGSSAAYNKWANPTKQLLAGALNPHSGWVFDDKARDWATIAGQALGAYGAVVAKDWATQLVKPYADALNRPEAPGTAKDRAAVGSASHAFAGDERSFSGPRSTYTQDLADEPVDIEANRRIVEEYNANASSEEAKLSLDADGNIVTPEGGRYLTGDHPLDTLEDIASAMVDQWSAQRSSLGFYPQAVLSIPKSARPLPASRWPLPLDLSTKTPADFVVAFGVAEHDYHAVAARNTGKIAINIQDDINVDRNIGRVWKEFPDTPEGKLEYSYVTVRRGEPFGLHPAFSGHMTQAALEGEVAQTLHFSTRGIVDLTPVLPAGDLPGFSDADFHSSAEVRQSIVHLQATNPGERRVDIYFEHEGGVTWIGKDANVAYGAPLPNKFARLLPNISYGGLGSARAYLGASLSSAGSVLGALSLGDAALSVVDDLKTDLPRAVLTATTTAGFVALAKYGPKYVTSRLGLYGAGVGAVLDVKRNTDRYVQDSYNFTVGAFDSIGLDAHDYPGAATALAIGYTVGAALTNTTVQPAQHLLERVFNERVEQGFDSALDSSSAFPTWGYP